MKKNLLLFAFFLCLSVGLYAQTVSVTANPGTTQNAGLGFSNYHVSEYIYTEAEIGASNFTTAATAIRKISLSAAAIGTPNTFNNVKIYLKSIPSSTTTFTTGTYTTTGYTQVFSGSITFPVAGWVNVDLNTNFTRTAGNNLQMMIERTDNVDHSTRLALFTWNSANGNNTSPTAATSRRYNGTAALSASTSLSTSAFRIVARFIAPLSTDATISAISTPTLSCNSTNNISVTLQNFGTSTIAAGAANVTLRLGGANSYSFTRSNTIALAYNETETIIFNNVNVANVGNTSDSSFVTLTGDQSAANDTIKGVFTTATNINVSSVNPAIEGAETTLPVFSYVLPLTSSEQLWSLSTAPPKYKNADLTDSLGAHGGNTFYLFDSYSGTASSAGIVSRLLSNCISLNAAPVNSTCTSSISFWMSHDNSYSTILDSLYLSISTDKGATWTRLAGYGRYGATYNVPTWIQQTVSLTNYQGQTFQIGFEGVSKYGNVIGLDDIIVSSTCTLPISLTSFSGERRGNINNLSWTTASETNNTGFELQRSADGINYSTLAFVASKATSGNSSAALTYSFDDAKPLISNGYYRLKQIDKDGKSTTSNTVLIKGLPVSNLTVNTIYPNPVKNSMNVIVTAAAQTTITLTVADFSGKVLSSQTKQMVSGDNQYQINTATLASGNYLLKVTDSKGETTTQRFTKQ